MSRGYWLSAITIVGLGLLAALGWSLKEWHDQREDAYRSSYEQYQHTKGDQAPGAGVDGKRSVADPKSYREEWRSEKDLEAQRDMSEWAFYMAIISGVGVIVTAIGVIYIALTLRATRDAVVSSNRAAEAAEDAVREAERTTNIARDTLFENRLGNELQLRAYLSLEPGPVSYNNGTLTCRIIQTNKGQTPAKNVIFACEFAVLMYPMPDNVLFSNPKWGPEMNVIAPGQEFVVTRPYNGLTTRNIEEWIASGERLYVKADIKYDDFFGGDHETISCWSYDPHELAIVLKPPNKGHLRFNYAAKFNDAT